MDVVIQLVVDVGRRLRGRVRVAPPCGLRRPAASASCATCGGSEPHGPHAGSPPPPPDAAAAAAECRRRRTGPLAPMPGRRRRMTPPPPHVGTPQAPSTRRGPPCSPSRQPSLGPSASEPSSVTVARASKALPLPSPRFPASSASRPPLSPVLARPPAPIQAARSAPGKCAR